MRLSAHLPFELLLSTAAMGGMGAVCVGVSMGKTASAEDMLFSCRDPTKRFGCISGREERVADACAVSRAVSPSISLPFLCCHLLHCCFCCSCDSFPLMQSYLCTLQCSFTRFHPPSLLPLWRRTSLRTILTSVVSRG
jgi:hypothetical protein